MQNPLPKNLSRKIARFFVSKIRPATGVIKDKIRGTTVRQALLSDLDWCGTSAPLMVTARHAALSVPLRNVVLMLYLAVLWPESVRCAAAVSNSQVYRTEYTQ